MDPELPQPSPRPAAHPDPRAELESLLASRVALIVIETRDERRALELVKAAGMRVRRSRNWGIFQWSVTEGLLRLDVDLGGPLLSVREPVQMLRHLRATPAAGIYVLLDFHPYLADPVNVRTLRDIAQGYAQVARTVVLVSYDLPLPGELEHLAARLRLSFPDERERAAIVARVLQEARQARPGAAIAPAAVDHEAIGILTANLAGLPASDVERLTRQALGDDGALTMRDIPAVLAAKAGLLNRGGVLSYEPDTARFAEIGGLHRLREWLLARKSAYDGSAPGLDPPKGVLLLGVQGCGKSLAARATAGILGVPLLRLDCGALYSKWHGESERNLRESLEAAEALAPCVVWIDEIDKALSSEDGDSGTSRRVLGTFLTWLSERHSRIFVVGTANDIVQLPPELVRKGRFDEIFFVDLPAAPARAEILAIHARKRNLVLSSAELGALAHAAEGFSGAELEQAVVAALYSANAAHAAPTAAQVLAEIRATRPLSVVMAEKVGALRAFASERTVPAD